MIIKRYNKETDESFIKAYVSNSIRNLYFYNLGYESKELVIKLICNRLDRLYCLILEENNEFLGFCIYDKSSIIPRLYYIYTKKLHQRKGIANKLIKEAFGYVPSEIEIPIKSPSLSLLFKSLNIKPIKRFYEIIES